MNEIESLARAIFVRLEQGHKVFIFGNGGSAADANHFSGELIKSFEIKKKLSQPTLSLGPNLEVGFPVLSLNANDVVISAIANDIGYDYIFAQQLVALASPNDVVIGLTTSGKSLNVLNGLITAAELHVMTVLFTGSAAALTSLDYEIVLSGSTTASIQEQTMQCLHQLARLIEQKFWDKTR